MSEGLGANGIPKRWEWAGGTAAESIPPDQSANWCPFTFRRAVYLRVHQRPGDAIAFNPDGLHCGRYHNDIPRRTLMLTYTLRASPIPNTYFSNQSWMLEPGHFNGLSGRARAYYDEFVDAYRETWLANLEANVPAPVHEVRSVQ